MGDHLWAGKPPRYVTKQLGQFSLAFPGSALIGWGKDRNVTPAGWQVTVYDPRQNVNSCSSESSCELLYPVTLVNFTTLLSHENCHFLPAFGNLLNSSAGGDGRSKYFK